MSSHHWHGIKGTISGKIPNLLGNCEVIEGTWNRDLNYLLNLWGFVIWSIHNLGSKYFLSWLVGFHGVFASALLGHAEHMYILCSFLTQVKTMLHSMFSLELALESRTLCQRFAACHWLQSIIFFHYTLLTSYLLTATPHTNDNSHLDSMAFSES